uniref:Uncharacterized protein n=1 Tax=Chromera velia CCMP2878 TaxID=1169474 RepID=A0A0G4I2M6_9ALVE|mmetsp:Transcript_54928/g.107446  ORF Transcript_54928/g.107446 Transcript_54928/m.107446 type:complete len:286 (+) Transcript_54928:111-968(+)|eukprot:Cvel_1715.t1-p1 / transcript=Cvel_1715.t1 / gene=Cvel_1715 / organism=Chromera_velia_CCMP2878 / gene_product=hypothetical protein / transcript_product=hypothetical protein / location=Cvel_scaffold62:42385-44458(+) / protein_length=285 / sequence_SO=supercontig / SO=protein_coding / is_pseudo=false
MSAVPVPSPSASMGKENVAANGIAAPTIGAQKKQMKAIQQAFVVPVLEATEDTVKPYGNLFSDFESEPCRLTKWPQKFWRPVEDGVSGGVAEGAFTAEWTRDGVLEAANSAITTCSHDGGRDVYTYGWLRGRDAASAATLPLEAALPSPPCAFIWTEINYHACGSQSFFCADQHLVLLVAKVGEDPATLGHGGSAVRRCLVDVRPGDFVAFRVPPGVGIHIDADVWHAPPVPLPHLLAPDGEGTGLCTPSKALVLTKQAKVHTKIYYDPAREHGTLLAVPLQLSD